MALPKIFNHTLGTHGVSKEYTQEQEPNNTHTMVQQNATTTSVYLCQVNNTVSCGACCGLYNLPDLSRNRLEKLLLQRTKNFAAVPRTEEALFHFQRDNRGPHRLSRPFAGFHHCPFLGLIGEKLSRVGCLLHPSAPGNDNTDFRSFSWYGELACRTYLCPTTKKLSPTHQLILTQTIDDWFIFGLIVTEHALIKGYFDEIEIRLGRQVSEKDFSLNETARQTLRNFSGLKCRWPFRKKNGHGPCNFFFENGLYTRPEVCRAHPGIRLSPFETILRELDSGFGSEKELIAAEQIIENHISRLVKALQ